MDLSCSPCLRHAGPGLASHWRCPESQWCDAQQPRRPPLPIYPGPIHSVHPVSGQHVSLVITSSTNTTTLAAQPHSLPVASSIKSLDHQNEDLHPCRFGPCCLRLSSGHSPSLRCKPRHPLDCIDSSLTVLTDLVRPHCHRLNWLPGHRRKMHLHEACIPVRRSDLHSERLQRC